ncbi:hypothetical protein OJAV_G00165720 [Oryzias javanicus]|uniref:Uncharacterized protein n=1 Tax=Oryzias javanicus TaxID=123683 RepID=A0A3S2U5H7_ORYJA|nr:hypothetical protein OJAV_G00165720 [Oryzias javanicus]
MDPVAMGTTDDTLCRGSRAQVIGASSSARGSAFLLLQLSGDSLLRAHLGHPGTRSSLRLRKDLKFGELVLLEQGAVRGADFSLVHRKPLHKLMSLGRS